MQGKSTEPLSAGQHMLVAVSGNGEMPGGKGVVGVEGKVKGGGRAVSTSNSLNSLHVVHMIADIFVKSPDLQVIGIVKCFEVLF